MIRFISATIAFCLAVGAADALVRLTYQMATNAEHAHRFDQLSYSAFNKALWEGKQQKPSK